MTLLEDLKWRGLINQVTDEKIFEVLEKEKVTFYLGADPTADSLHVGHLIAYMVAKRFAEYGHNPILLIGGATGLIGDPSGRNSERKLLTVEETLKNADGIAKQVKKMLPNAEIVNNYDWVGKMDVVTFLRDIGKNFSINYMMAKDSVKSRLENGISFTEFSYQIIQALDFYTLYKDHSCRLQIGGADQWGNITSGTELIRKISNNDEAAYGFTFPLLTKSDGTKFGKSAGGAVWLDKDKTSPYEFYQFWLNTADADAITYLKRFTFLSHDEILDIEEASTEAPHLRFAQKVLAKELTTFIHGEEDCAEAIKISEALFSGDINSLTKEEIALGFKDLDKTVLENDLELVEVLLLTGLAKSKREAREFITTGAVSVNGEKETDVSFIVTKEKAIGNTYTMIRRGKKVHALVEHK